MERLCRNVSDKEIEQVACDESQHDWIDLRLRTSYQEGWIKGAKWYREQTSIVLDATQIYRELNQNNSIPELQQDSIYYSPDQMIWFANECIKRLTK